MNDPGIMPIIITILLATNTGVVAIAATLLFRRLDSQDASLIRAHGRIDDHIGKGELHCSPEKQQQHRR